MLKINKVLELNLELPRNNLVMWTSGNVRGDAGRTGGHQSQWDPL
jgi:hypothetical protein